MLRCRGDDYTYEVQISLIGHSLIYNNVKREPKLYDNRDHSKRIDEK